MISRVRLTRLDSTHTNMRTDIVEGFLHGAIIEGEPVVVHTSPLNGNEAYRRIIRTSPVMDISEDSTISCVRIYTYNSRYQIDFLPEDGL